MVERGTHAIVLGTTPVLLAWEADPGKGNPTITFTNLPAEITTMEARKLVQALKTVIRDADDEHHFLTSVVA